MNQAASAHAHGSTRVRRVRAWGAWLTVLIVVTALMVAVRARLDRVHVTLAYLLVVQLASARGGRPLGITLAVLAFLGFNWFFLQPYGTLALANPLDWLVLVAFLATSAISAELLYRAQELGAERARRAAATDRAAFLEQSQRAKDEALAGVSHDLRTPLTSIKGVAHEIAESGDDRGDTIEQEADRLNALVSKLLDFSRLTLGAAALDVQANEAEDLLGVAVQQVQARVSGREIHIHIDAPDALHFGRFDFVQSLRVLVNLIENAAKYSPDGTPIDVGVRRADGELRFWVADRGPGVPAGERERVFDPFYRPRGGAPDAGGAGLGLSIARGLAQAQGGAVTYEPRPGGGSVFTLSVPAVDLDTPEAVS